MKRYNILISKDQRDSSSLFMFVSFVKYTFMCSVYTRMCVNLKYYLNDIEFMVCLYIGRSIQYSDSVRFIVFDAI